MTTSSQTPGSLAASGPGVSLSDLVGGIVAGYINDGRSEVSRAEGQTGQIEVRVKVQVDSGRVAWSRGAVSFERYRPYKEAHR